MKIKLFLLLVGLSTYSLTYAQRASDVLENGIPIKTDNYLFLEFDETNETLNYEVSTGMINTKNSAIRINNALSDSMIFVIKEATEVFIRPLNPLNYTTSTETKVIDDPIDKAAITALTTIIDGIALIVPKPKDPDPEARGIKPAPVKKCDTLFTWLKTNIDEIKSKLEDEEGQKTRIASIFKQLKAISFKTEALTKSELESAKKRIDSVKNYYESLKSQIADAQKHVKEYDCDTDSLTNYMAQYLIGKMLEEFMEVNQTQYKRYENLKSVYDIVYNEYKSLSEDPVTNFEWIKSLGVIKRQKGKIVEYKITTSQSGYQLSEENEIVKVESKSLISRTLRFRRFQRFIPEVSVGLAYTNFSHNTYGTTTDSSGLQRVASPTENNVRNLNLSTMVNFNYYVSDWNVNFLYQVGLGINGEIPTLLTGFGLRLNINGLRRLAISGGIAMTWIKELESLSVGDEVTGTADIDKDLKYQFSWPPKPYVGIQYNF